MRSAGSWLGLDRRVVALIGFLVVLDTVSTYLCTLYYPAELEFNPILRHMLLAYGSTGLLLYAPLEFAFLTLLLSVHSRLLVRLGVRSTFKYYVVVLIALYALVSMNFAGYICAVLSRP